MRGWHVRRARAGAYGVGPRRAARRWGRGAPPAWRVRPLAMQGHMGASAYGRRARAVGAPRVRGSGGLVDEAGRMARGRGQGGGGVDAHDAETRRCAYAGARRTRERLASASAPRMILTPSPARDRPSGGSRAQWLGALQKSAHFAAQHCYSAWECGGSTPAERLERAPWSRGREHLAPCCGLGGRRAADAIWLVRVGGADRERVGVVADADAYVHESDERC